VTPSKICRNYYRWHTHTLQNLKPQWIYTLDTQAQTPTPQGLILKFYETPLPGLGCSHSLNHYKQSWCMTAKQLPYNLTIDFRINNQLWCTTATQLQHNVIHSFSINSLQLTITTADVQQAFTSTFIQHKQLWCITPTELQYNLTVSFRINNLMNHRKNWHISWYLTSIHIDFHKL